MRKLVIFLSLVLFVACQQPKQQAVVVVSKNYNQAFTKWIHKVDKNIKVVEAYGITGDSLKKLLKLADGIIISGGEDINPSLYGEPEEITRCGKINVYRDQLEMNMIRYAFNHKIPLLAICRGHQLLNVTFGGSLIVDIPEDLGSNLHRKDGHHTEHEVFIVPNTMLKRIVKVDSGEVWSNHHQAVKDLAEIFRVSAYAPDSVIEAIELKDTNKANFVLGVQWHPESMADTNPLNYRIRQAFLARVKQHFKH